MGCPRGRRRRWVGVASGERQAEKVGGWRKRSQHMKSKVERQADSDGECRDSRDRKAEIESEWAEWQTGLAEQQVHAEIDPRPEEEDDGWLRDPSFISPAVQGRALPRSDVLSPKSGAPIGPRPPHGPAAIAGSGLIVHPARHNGAAESSRSEPHDMNLLASNSQAVLW